MDELVNMEIVEEQKGNYHRFYTRCMQYWQNYEQTV